MGHGRKYASGRERDPDMEGATLKWRNEREISRNGTHTTHTHKRIGACLSVGEMEGAKANSRMNVVVICGKVIK